MNQQLTYAIIGVGGFGNLHIKELSLMDNTYVCAVCDKHEDAAHQTAEKYGIKSVYTDYNEMLEKETPDIVVVATSDQIHCEATVAALNAGCHVLCEKPMALKLDECKQMIEASEKTGKKLMIGQVCRYAPAFREAKRLIDEGAIGELFFVESEYAHDYANAPGTDNWRKQPERHPIIGGACHAIDLLRWIAGNPYEVMAYSNHKMMCDWPVDDTTVAIMRFPNDVVGKVFCSISCKRDYTMRTVLYGSKGTIIVSNTDSHITIYREKAVSDKKILDGVLPDETENSIQIKIPVDQNSHNIAGEHEDFRRAVIDGTDGYTDGREGASTVAACLAIVKACNTGKSVEIEYDF